MSEQAPEPTPTPEPTPEPTPAPEAPERPTGDEAGMTEQEIRDAGLTIDVPYETGPGASGPIRYADDAGEEWVPEPGWEDRLAGGPGTTPEDEEEAPAE
jgi:hypothetical protein